jgi:D-alanyl-lipoteichoic acid acyltransferase DltB (MBOAT superfamily)
VVFNSLTFAIFFAIILFLHYLPFGWTVKKFNLLVASYVFYAAWNPPFVLLLIVSAVVDFFLAKWMDRTERSSTRKLFLITSLVLNLGLLGFFKYGSFLLDNFVRFLALFGIHYQAATPDIILPLGISFYTFETISYLIDVYRRKIKPWGSFLDYALFLTFFPHLVAGPIVRASDFLPQCQTPRKATAAQLGWGLSLLVIGLFEKVVLADSCLAPVADKAYSAAHQAAFGDAWIGTLAFSGQIFFDFAGYSTCAIGVALCFGFVLNDNFHFPYAAIGFSDFWQRWHISLSTWLRDYLYIPLGGNRQGEWRTHFNLMTTMLLGGLWHGASWRFVAWGGLHGSYLIGERTLRHAFQNLSWADWWLARALLGLLTYVLVCITWVLFRAKDFGTAFQMLTAMFDREIFARSHLLSLVTRTDAAWVLGITAGLLAVHGLLRNSSLERAVGCCPWWLRAVGLALLMIGLALAPGDDRAFIYFQF